MTKKTLINQLTDWQNQLIHLLQIIKADFIHAEKSVAKNTAAT